MTDQQSSNPSFEQLYRFVERVACYDDYTHDDVDELNILTELQTEAKKLWKPDWSPSETRAWRSLKDDPIPDDAFAFQWGEWWIELPPHPSIPSTRGAVETTERPCAHCEAPDLHEPSPVKASESGSMSVFGIYAVIDCDECGGRFEVELEEAYEPPQGWSLWDVAEDAVRGGFAGEGGMLESTSIQDEKMLCAVCTKKRDAETQKQEP